MGGGLSVPSYHSPLAMRSREKGNDHFSDVSKKRSITKIIVKYGSFPPRMDGECICNSSSVYVIVLERMK